MVQIGECGKVQDNEVPDHLSGLVVACKYKLLRKIGSGSFGDIYLGMYQRLLRAFVGRFHESGGRFFLAFNSWLPLRGFPIQAAKSLLARGELMIDSFDFCAATAPCGLIGRESSVALAPGFPGGVSVRV